MTPLYDILSRYLSPGLSRVALAIIYATLLVLIVAFLAPRGDINMIYLDVGK